MPSDILVVDSDSLSLAATTDALSAAGYTVRAASTFAEAKSQFAMRSPDLLLADVWLGRFNGLHLVARGRADDPSLAAIVIHRVPDPVLEREAICQGAVYLVRPLPPARLLAAVAGALGERQISGRPRPCRARRFTSSRRIQSELHAAYASDGNRHRREPIPYAAQRTMVVSFDLPVLGIEVLASRPGHLALRRGGVPRVSARPTRWHVLIDSLN